MPSNLRAPYRPGIGQIAMVIVVTFIGILMGISLIALQRVRDQAAFEESTNNLKTIMLAMHAYHDVNKFLPYCSTVRLQPNTPTGGSAHFQLLPYLDQKAAYKTGGAEGTISVYRCPGRRRPTTVCWTDYFYNLYLNDQESNLCGKNNKRTLVSITDGSSNTIGFGHGTISMVNWSTSTAFNGSGSIFATQSDTGFETFRGGIAPMPQRDGDARETVTSWGGPFSQGALMGMCDATVRLFSYKTLPLEFNSYLTPSGGEGFSLD